VLYGTRVTHQRLNSLISVVVMLGGEQVGVASMRCSG
jgi:hypothetical protein